MGSLTKYRVVLILNTLSLLYFGIAFMVDPHGMTGQFGITLAGTDAIADVSAVYGGFEIGMGLFLVWAAMNPPYLKAGLVAATFSLVGFMSGRIIGIVHGGAPTEATFRLLSLDVVGALLNVVFLVLYLRAENAGKRAGRSTATTPIG